MVSKKGGSMNSKATAIKSAFGSTGAAASTAVGLHRTTNRVALALRLFLCLILLPAAACSPAGSSGSGAPGRDAAASACLYALMTGSAGSQAGSDRVYIALAGGHARIYQRDADAAFCLGTFPVARYGNRLEICISEQNRREAMEHAAQTLDAIASTIKNTATASVNPAATTGVDSRLENILLFLGNGTMDALAVTTALEELEIDRPHAPLDKIQDLKKDFIFDRMDTGDPTSNFIRAKDGIKQPVAQLLAHENFRNVFYEKEILGSILSDMEVLDRDIADCFASGARIARENPARSGRKEKIAELADRLEQLKQLGANAARLKRQYSRFLSAIGFEENYTEQNQVLVSAWNTALWQTMTACFGPDGTRQYDIQNAVCRPLERLRAHCAMAGDAARVLQALEAFESLAGPTGGNAVIIFRRADAAWTCIDRNVTLQPVPENCLAERLI